RSALRAVSCRSNGGLTRQLGGADGICEGQSLSRNRQAAIGLEQHSLRCGRELAITLFAWARLESDGLSRRPRLLRLRGSNPHLPLVARGRSAPAERGSAWAVSWGSLPRRSSRRRRLFGAQALCSPAAQGCGGLARPTVKQLLVRDFLHGHARASFCSSGLAARAARGFLKGLEKTCGGCNPGPEQDRRKRLPIHRWRALVAALRAHEPVPAGALHAMFFTIATGSDDAALGGQDVASAAALRRLPLVRTLSLSEAVAACSARDGYLPATAQAGLLEAYGGLPVAAEALSLADAIRTAELPRPVRASRRRGRRGSGR
ncbi:unnamed protein product, partial [Effrenium voratum]